MNVSGYLIAYKDQATIKKALNSFYGICDEIIVCMETKPGDNTRHIVEEEQKTHPIKIYDYTMQGDWAHARNFALEKCTGDWIITVDADEWFDEAGKEKIKELLKDDCDVWEVVQYSYLDNKEVVMNPAIRIFKKGLYYSLPTHETLINAINEKGYRVGKSNIIMHHTGYMGDIAYKLKRNYEILREDHPLYEYYTGCLEVKERRDGEEILLKALDKINNNSLRAYVYCVLAENYLNKNEIFNAVCSLKLSLETEPVQNLAHKIFADIYLNLGLLDNAIEHIEAILENSKVIKCRMFNDRAYPEGLSMDLQEMKNHKLKVINHLKGE